MKRGVAGHKARCRCVHCRYLKGRPYRPKPGARRKRKAAKSNPRPSKRSAAKAPASLQLAYLPANQRYVLMFGDAILEIAGTRFWKTRAELLLELNVRGLDVAPDGHAVIDKRSPSQKEGSRV